MIIQNGNIQPLELHPYSEPPQWIWIKVLSLKNDRKYIGCWTIVLKTK